MRIERAAEKARIAAASHHTRGRASILGVRPLLSM
jgi:hypothetical protein